MIYRKELMQLQIRETCKKWKDAPLGVQLGKRNTTLIKLPKPQKRLFKKIVKGKANYNDYKLVK
jgi:hypothetical protein